MSKEILKGVLGLLALPFIIALLPLLLLWILGRITWAMFEDSLGLEDWDL